MISSRSIIRYVRRAYLSRHFPKVSTLLKNRDRLLGYYGFLGDGNFGDDLVYEAARLLLQPCILVPSTLRKPMLTGFLFKTKVLRLRGEVLGGGTLVGPRVELVDNGLSDGGSVFVHGTGARLAFSEDWIGALQSRRVFGGLRGEATKARLAEKGCKLAVDGDAAFYLYQGVCTPHDHASPVLVNLGTHHPNSELKTARSELRRFIAALLDRGVPVEFLPFHSADVRLGRDLKAEFSPVKLHDVPIDFAAAKAIFNRASFAVGERLHFAVMSLLCSRPCFSIMYDAKHAELLESLECLSIGAPPLDVDCADLLERYARRSEFEWSTIHARLATYRERQKESARAFISHLRVHKEL